MAAEEAHSGRNRLQMTAQVAAEPDRVFSYFTDQFHELWPGEMKHKGQGSNPDEPLGLGFVRTMHTAAGALDEEIVTHERPNLIEYKVINGDEVKIHNHLGRIELSDRDGGTHVDYTISFDYRPPWQGPIAAHGIKLAWAVRSKRRLRKAFPG
jgi:uncharacterized protein YndB with AHSA1/START domain